MESFDAYSRFHFQVLFGDISATGRQPHYSTLNKGQQLKSCPKWGKSMALP